MSNARTLTVEVTLPWFKAHAVGRATDTYMVQVVQSQFDGEVCYQAVAQCLTGSDNVGLPPYIAAKDIAAFIQAIVGPDYSASEGAKLS